MTVDESGYCRRPVFYIGVTADLVDRVGRHRTGQGAKFAAKYQCKRLVWYEMHADMSVAIQREKSLKRYLRQWKIELIEKSNPDWLDLWEEIRPHPLERRTIEEVRRGDVPE